MVETKKVTLFLGCIIPNRYPEIEVAAKHVLDKLGVDWVELKGASCCPAPGIFRSVDKTTWLVLASRNIVLAEAQERDILTLCNGCFSTLNDVNKLLKKEISQRDMVNRHLSEVGKNYRGTIEVRHIVDFLHRDIGISRIKKTVENKLNLKVAVHYGCHLLKPSCDRNMGSVEFPVSLDELVTATGAQSIAYGEKMSCCGAGGGVRSALPDVAIAMTEKKLQSIRDAGADCIVSACPFCHLQLDTGQSALQKRGKEYSIPVLHYMQLLALSQGV